MFRQDTREPNVVDRRPDVRHDLPRRSHPQIGEAPIPGDRRPRAPPNIVLILTDDQRADTLRFMPNVQRLLVGNGIRFSNGYVVNPVCCPSRSSILTGDYSHTTSVYTNHPEHTWWVPRLPRRVDDRDMAAGRRLPDLAVRQVSERLRRDHLCTTRVGPSGSPRSKTAATTTTPRSPTVTRCGSATILPTTGPRCCATGPCPSSGAPSRPSRSSCTSHRTRPTSRRSPSLETATRSCRSRPRRTISYDERDVSDKPDHVRSSGGSMPRPEGTSTSSGSARSRPSSPSIVRSRS